MAYSAKVGSFNIDPAVTVGNTQAITGVGFEPKIVLFWWGGSTASGDTVAGGTYNLGFGAAIDSTHRRCFVGISEDAQADSDGLRYQNNAAVITCYTDTATLDGTMDFSSMDVGGFTLVVDDQFTQAYRISYLALGGTDLTNTYIGSGYMRDTVGTKDFTDAGFQPDALLIFCSTGTSESGTFNSSRMSLGWAISPSAQGVVTDYAGDAGATSVTYGYGYNAEIFANNADNYLDTRAGLNSFLANGFRLDIYEDGGEYWFYYICLKGGQYLVGDLTTRTDGNDITETVGFQPAAVLFASANRALSTQDTPSSHARLSIGAASSTSARACAAISDESSLADTETAFANYDSAVYAHVKDDAIEALMDLKSIESEGFTCVMDNTETAGCWVTYLAIGPTYSPSASESASESVSPSPTGGESASESASPSPTLESASPSLSESASPSPTLESASPSISESASPSPTLESASPSLSESVSPSPTLESASPSLSESASPSPTLESASPSLSESVSPSPTLESASPSISESASPSPTLESASPSISESVSPSPTLESASPSLSESASPSPTLESASPSLSESVSPSVSVSASPSPGPTGSVCWGHVTGVLEDNIETFAGNWTGTGTIAGIGDAETICLDDGEYMVSEMIETGTQPVELLQNHYDPSGEDVTLQYRHGATAAACTEAAWNNYIAIFSSLGYVQVRLEN